MDMEGAQRIFDFLPISYRNPEEQEYIHFLWDSFVTNYEAGKFQFAFLAYHMLFMCFVYFEIWQIKQNFSKDFENAMIGFRRDTENKLLSATSPFTLWKVNESIVFRFFKLIGMDNADIGQLTKIVNERNNVAHSNGNIFFRTDADLDVKVEEILHCVEKIQKFSGSILEPCYTQFLKDGSDPETREYLDNEDQVREALINRNYHSAQDISIMLSYDIKKLKRHPHYEEIIVLEKVLRDVFREFVEI